jgi:hypothetical protein
MTDTNTTPTGRPQTWGTCPECDRKIQLRRDGKIRAHGKMTGQSKRSMHCAGAGAGEHPKGHEAHHAKPVEEPAAAPVAEEPPAALSAQFSEVG